MVFGLWFFKRAWTVSFLGYRHEFFFVFFFLYEAIYYMSANSKGSGETALMRRLAWAFSGRLGDKYPFLICWLTYYEYSSIPKCFSVIYRENRCMQGYILRFFREPIFQFEKIISGSCFCVVFFFFFFFFFFHFYQFSIYIKLNVLYN